MEGKGLWQNDPQRNADGFRIGPVLIERRTVRILTYWASGPRLQKRKAATVPPQNQNSDFGPAGMVWQTFRPLDSLSFPTATCHLSQANHRIFIRWPNTQTSLHLVFGDGWVKLSMTYH